MDGIDLHLHRWVLNKVKDSLCEPPIPRSGSEGEKVNCYVVAFDKANEPYLIVTGFDGETLTVKEWNGSNYDDEYEIPLSSIAYPLEYLYITHYYGLANVQYTGLSDFILNWVPRIEYLKIKWHRFWDKTDQHFFNQKKLVTKKRIELLRIFIDRHIAGKEGIGLIDLMLELYSIRWILHPDSETQERQVEFYLTSLVDSGDIEIDGTLYKVTGKAIGTIEIFEEEERRHTENVKLQRKAVWLTGTMALLTAMIALFALVQAGAIKLPVLLDFTN